MTTLADRIVEQVGGRRLAVVGVGHRLRGDDAAGSLVAERLAGVAGGGAIDAEQTPENHLVPLLARAPGVVLFVDAVDLGAAPGALRLVGPADLAPRAESTHAPSLRLTADLLAAHGVASLVLGIQPRRTTPGMGLSAEVAAAVDEAVAVLAPLLGLGREAAHA